MSNNNEKGMLVWNLKDFKAKFVNRLRDGYRLSYEEVEDLLANIEKTLKKEEILIPISIFKNKELSAFEAICKYLKEELRFSYHQIAILLDRDDRTIWSSYNEAVKKRKERLEVRKSRISVPYYIFKDRRLSVLEALVTYLRDNFKLRYSEIADLLNRDERNIWTVYHRGKNKI